MSASSYWIFPMSTIKRDVYLAACIPESSTSTYAVCASVRAKPSRLRKPMMQRQTEPETGVLPPESRYRPSGRFGSVSRNRTQCCRLYFVGSDRCSRDGDSDRHRADAVPPQKAPRRTVARLHKKPVGIFPFFIKWLLHTGEIL